MCKKFMIGAMKPVSLLFDQPTYIKFGNKLYKQIIGIPMGTNCAPLVADWFNLLCIMEVSPYENDPLKPVLI